MEISEVRVKLINNPTDRLKAFCSVTFDGDFVIRDIKIIEGSGGIFVAMPSRKLADHCPKCRAKNHLRAAYCNECGASLGKERVQRDRVGRRKLHADIAHPINSECRHRLQERVVEAFQEEVAASQEPGYQPTAYDDDDDDFGTNEYTDMIEDLKRDAAARRKGGRPEPASVDVNDDDDDDDSDTPDWQRDILDTDEDDDAADDAADDDDAGDEEFDDFDDEDDDEEEEEFSPPKREVAPIRVAAPPPAREPQRIPQPQRAPQPQRTPQPQRVESKIDESEESVFGVGLVEEKRSAPKPQPPAPVKREAPQPASPAPESEEDDEFGAGIV